MKKKKRFTNMYRIQAPHILLSKYFYSYSPFIGHTNRCGYDFRCVSIPGSDSYMQQVIQNMPTSGSGNLQHIMQ